ncbi:hypothetical protein [Spartinivicinus ruber]|uniref:hypothetical protein n=1 Tax=Spartinivicinus ruber TaxID=2683272 RepID=UPI0013D50DC4|nr:hypothetical protein [Spartinivicinus ruber]
MKRLFIISHSDVEAISGINHNMQLLGLAFIAIGLIGLNFGDNYAIGLLVVGSVATCLYLLADGRKTSTSVEVNEFTLDA